MMGSQSVSQWYGGTEVRGVAVTGPEWTNKVTLALWHMVPTINDKTINDKR